MFHLENNYDAVELRQVIAADSHNLICDFQSRIGHTSTAVTALMQQERQKLNKLLK